MAASPQQDESSETKYQFKQRSDSKIKELLDGKDKKSTQRATKGALNHFKAFLRVKKLPKLEALNDIAELAEILHDFYVALRPMKNKDYASQSIKCIRSGLNRYMRKEKGIDICNDKEFTRANEAFTCLLIESKKKGKGITKSHTPITEVDLERIYEYFNHDHMSFPQPKRLQQQMIFYVIYYFCRRERENLYKMNRDTFKLVVEPTGEQYVMQDHDEIDKNHGIKDTTKNKQGKMYQTHSMSYFYT